MTIADRAVLVTGANRGIGQALVEEAMSRGARRVYAGTRQPLARSERPRRASASSRRSWQQSPSSHKQRDVEDASC
jgi:NAD(P)-dependent dehydrogenase (short-subunit alcohol dehydrogenase family)